jgi:release factor glutamine methyltransferase
MVYISNWKRGVNMTIKDALNKGMIILKNNNVESPKLKARLLLQYILKQTRQYIIVYDNKDINKKEQFEYFVNIEKLTAGVPLQHITHSQEFMKMDFFVNENVLIPRPDTEILVEEVIKIASVIKEPKILDLCTGSGAIAISIAKNIKDAKIYAIDISDKALEVAKKNAEKLEVADRIEFVRSNLFNKIEKMKFDIIVTNPPYIKKKDIKYLSQEVQKEPLIALDGGNDGLEFYKKILDQATDYLKLGSYICMEIGYNQKAEVLDIVKKTDKYIDTYSKKDLHGNDRIIVTKVGE